MEIYRAGLDGLIPSQQVSLEELDRQAESVLEKPAYDYVAGGAVRKRPSAPIARPSAAGGSFRGFCATSGRRDLGVEVLGLRLPVPVMIAPVGVLSILHKDADLAVARAARAARRAVILSTASSKTMEEVAAELGDSPRWFQLYWPSDEELAASFLARAERAGYQAIVVTVDTAMLGWRERDLQNAYLPFVLGEGLANYFSDPVFQKRVGGDPRSNPARAIEYFLGIFSDPSHTWDDFGRLVQIDAAAGSAQRRARPGRRAEGRRARGRRRDRLQPRRTPARRRNRHPGCPAPRRGRHRRPTRPCSSIAASAAGRTSSKPWRWGALRVAGPAILLRPGDRRREGRARSALEPDRRHRPHAGVWPDAFRLRR